MPAARSICTFPCVSILLVVLFGCCAANAQAPKTIFDVLDSQGEVLDMELITDLTLLRDQKNTNDYQPATLKYKTGKKEEQTWEIKIRSRGKYRRRICVFPPLKLNFPKSILKEQGLEKDDELKLVTHCIPGDEGKTLIIREYLVYKLYEKLSPVYFKVKLAKVRYTDPKSGERIFAWGMLMEDENSLAKRLNAEICDECFSNPADVFHQDNLHTLTLFQYLISNTDWNLAMVRNLKMLKPKDGGLSWLVPYDFDFSGMVNASYARPSGDYKQTSIRQRVFLGSETDDAELAGAIQLFKDKREEMRELIRNFKLLDIESRLDMVNFLDSFYESLDKGIKRP